MRGKPGAHYSIQREEICVNPSPLPPAVGLTLGKGTTTPSFSFAADIKVGLSGVCVVWGGVV